MFELDSDKEIEKKKYPEAPFKIMQYEVLASSLEAIKTTILDKISEAGTYLDNNVSELESSNLAGDYYNTYVSKKNDWVVQCRDMISKFDLFVVDLQKCINEANRLKQMWTQRNSEC
ncbi:MAG: hypothetical protein E7257_03400 [Lachnospiraceae bacterium]|nr:hypothetical protein [Lachnospiraceae bacterium]MBQ9935599.1 hypothetical protein [Lachnospiraceae bacterium]